MLSIRTKRKDVETCKAKDPWSKASSPTTRNQLIDGSFELIDMLYEYITKDGAGLTYVQRMINSTKNHVDLYDDFKDCLSKTASVSSSLLQTTKLLGEILETEARQLENVHDCLGISDSATHECSALNSHYHSLLLTISRMRCLIAHSETLAGSNTNGLAEDLTALKKEVNFLEEQLNSYRDFQLQRYHEYEQAVNNITTSITAMVASLQADLEHLNKLSGLSGHFDALSKTTEQELLLLDQREHDNMIMLNDLISFLVQLKSILTCLKEDQ